MSVKSKIINRIKIIEGDINNSVVEDRINNFLDEISCKENLYIDDIKYIMDNTGEYQSAVIRYSYTEHTDDNGMVVTPKKKYGIMRYQNQIDRLVDDHLSELLEVANDMDDFSIEEFCIYDDYKDRDRDHVIVIYSFNEYQ